MTVTVRKRPGETALNLVFRMKQNEGYNGESFVTLDDVRVYQQQLLDDNYCNYSSKCDY